MHKIIGKIKKYKLAPASKRKLTLFTVSCFAEAYIDILQEKMGFSYNAVAATGKSHEVQAYFNEKHIVDSTTDYLKKHDPLKLVRNQWEEFMTLKEKYDNLQTAGNERLDELSKIIPQYMGIIVVYNCFWRLFDTQETALKHLNKHEVDLISEQRDKIAKLYVVLDQDVLNLSYQLGLEMNCPDFFLNLTVKEYRRLCLAKHCIDCIEKIKKRGQGYSYVLEKNNEIVSTDESVIEQINDLFLHDHQEDNLKGLSAYSKSKVSGIVIKNDDIKMQLDKNYILVKSMTQPDDVILAKKCAGIVTDEGGILSHAAVLARELKIPCIIGTKIATKILHSRDLIELDCNLGIIRKLEKK